MNRDGMRPGGRAAQMRAEFDAGFSSVPLGRDTGRTDVLAIRIGAEECVLRLHDVVEVISRPQLTPVPTGQRSLLGFTISRGSPVAAYDLALLLGRPAGGARWLVVTAAEPATGLAFEHLDGHRRLRLGDRRTGRLIEIQPLIDVIKRFTSSSRVSMELGS